MADEEPLYVGLVDPVDLRKDILNSSRIIISSLRKYEAFQQLRTEKEKKIIELRKSLREINILVKRIKQMMPKSALKQMPMQSPAPSTPSEEIIGEKTRLAELEDELAKVEEKLKVME
jgi:hypothetical protein